MPVATATGAATARARTTWSAASGCGCRKSRSACARRRHRGGVGDHRPGQLGRGQEAVALEEAHFGLVQRILERFEVFGKDPARRQSAAFKLGTSGDASAIPVLVRAVEGETHRDVRAAMEDALAKLRLRSPDPADRLGAVKQLGRRGSEAAVPQLQALVAEEADPAVKAAARTALQDIDRFVVQRNVVGDLFKRISLAALLLIMSLGLAGTLRPIGI